MAPEQIDGEPVNPRTDIYALGMSAYEMVTGQGPFPEDDLKSLLDLHLSRDIPTRAQIVPNLPDELREFILKAAHCNPDKRYQDMGAAAAALGPMVNGSRLTGSLAAYAKRKMSTLFLSYTDENQLALNQCMEEFSTKAKMPGVEVKSADLRQL